MSDKPGSRYYNTYVSEPFALVLEEMSAAEVEMLRDGGRQVFRSGHFIQAFIDASEESNQAIGAFAAALDRGSKRLRVAAGASARGLPTDYVMGVNPPPIVGAGGITTPPRADCVCLIQPAWWPRTWKIRYEAIDAALPSPRMPIVFMRVTANQDVMDGPFGPGWDHSYNQRLFEYDESFSAPKQASCGAARHGG
jgi:hypothetical protein